MGRGVIIVGLKFVALSPGIAYIRVDTFHENSLDDISSLATSLFKIIFFVSLHDDSGNNDVTTTFRCYRYFAGLAADKKSC